jgi:hypothetical protein
MTRLMMMSVIARPTSLTRRRLHRREKLPELQAREIQVTDRRGAGTPASPPVGEPIPALAQTCDGDSSQDETTYRCGCGYVFHAAVSTTVACPHCGDTQAW